MRFSKAMKTGAGLVRLADGSLLSVADLPPRDTRRWVASRKLAVVRAVIYQLRSQEEVLETYSISEEELIRFARSKLAGFKTPKTIIFQELPKTSTGKIQKFELRKIASEGS